MDAVGGAENLAAKFPLCACAHVVFVWLVIVEPKANKGAAIVRTIAYPAHNSFLHFLFSLFLVVSIVILGVFSAMCFAFSIPRYSAKGCGFPVSVFVTVVCITTGVIIDTFVGGD